MIIYTSEQGSLQWKMDRAGAITASRFVDVRAKVGMLDPRQQAFVEARLSGKTESEAKEIAGYKSAPKAISIQKALDGEPVGDWSDAAKNYAFRLAAERIGGVALDDSEFETWAMRRGREMEEPCRLRHEADIGEIVELAGFITTDDGKFGCSADAFVGVDGGGEYKCFTAPEKLRPIYFDNDWGDVMDQVQGGMWIAGKAWWDSCLYCPALESIGLDFVRQRHYRDDNYIEAMERDLVEFDRYVEKARGDLLVIAREKGVLPQEAAAALAPAVPNEEEAELAIQF